MSFVIKAVIFDCFGVLYVDAGSYFLEKNVPDYHKLYSELRRIFNAGDYGLISQAEINQAVADLTGLDIEFVSSNIQAHHQRNHELLDYALSLRSNYKLAMLSNIGPGGMDQFFNKREQEELFEAVILSGEEHTVKPNPEIYEIAAERLGLLTSECLMIDDKLENCWGADAVGMPSVHYKTNKQTMIEVDSLLGIKRA